ncbi:hypothetical protein RHVP.R10 [Cricetid gammaherpesvirus 2]|uniref:Uncharacterized protein n=1 Tax=Cricetid gammaherpesvirus 2 TaxID=1605972 RepID=E9M5J0_9GAMA|nr:hypothetical protein RHVP.R10 [Cricetid gammaherpesvirus 2]ADW24348.1 hypothetical protein RHVP.R10 [Cricetid gammaherpesvirus 2]ADW24430.1 hypothetical protein RHVP-L.R10 [Cricetid gammaherpesvirus 2]
MGYFIITNREGSGLSNHGNGGILILTQQRVMMGMWEKSNQLQRLATSVDELVDQGVEDMWYPSCFPGMGARLPGFTERHDGTLSTSSFFDSP